MRSEPTADHRPQPQLELRVPVQRGLRRVVAPLDNPQDRMLHPYSLTVWPCTRATVRSAAGGSDGNTNVNPAADGRSARA